ncbi:MAG: glycosyltransferase [Chthoniobacterales bacterium]|nr:glycosyltransferase [Chthoniobacterales bacterium]
MNSGLLLFHAFTGTVLLLTGLNSLITLLIVRRLRPLLPKKDAPMVSILVPARDEARQIVSCLNSLAAQNYPRFEVILLDDNSNDGTRALAEEMGFAAEGNRRVISGKQLPEGWTGKVWACHQLAQAAAGDYLLFTDADTVHGPATLATAMKEAQRTRASLFSLWPRQITKSLGEKAVIPLLYLAGIGLMPHFILSAAQRFPAFAALLPRSFLRKQGVANGQFLLFRRADYFAIGGHAAVRHHLVEDVALGRQVAMRTAEGFRLINADGTLLLQCRMYENFAEVWSGFTKNCRAAFELSLGSFVGAGLLQVTVFLAPFGLLCVPGRQRWLALAEVLGIYGLRLIYAARYRSSILGALLHPLGEIMALLIALNSWRRSTGRGVEWKGRTYQVVHEAPAY